MTEYYFPSLLKVAGSELTIEDNAARQWSPLSGACHVIARGADRLKLTLEISNLEDDRRAALQQLLTNLRGGINSVWVRDHSYTQRGSFPATELYTNGDFADGTTGWSKSAAVSWSVQDQAYYATVIWNSGGGVAYIYDNSGKTITQYAAYALRAVVEEGSGDFNAGGSSLMDIRFGSYGAATDYARTYPVDYGYQVTNGVPTGTKIYGSLVWNAYHGLIGSYLKLPWWSLARCALVDFAPNKLLQSEAFNTTWTAVRCSVSPNAVVAPDGNTTADQLIEDSGTTNTHQLYQDVAVTSSAIDVTLSVSIKASQDSPSSRRYARIEIANTAHTHYTHAIVDLTSGSFYSVALTGTEFSMYRYSVVNQGNGWYRWSLTGRKGTGVTGSLRISIYPVNNSGNYAYAGDGTSHIYLWGASLSWSSFPVRYQKTTTATATDASPGRTVMYLRALPASTNDLLMPGDQFQVGSELKIVTDALHSDASGLGVLRFYPPLRETPADGDPVHIASPMGKMMLANSSVEWSSRPGGNGSLSDATIELIEDVR